MNVMAGEEKKIYIFISYGRETDVTNFVKQLKRDLEANDFSVWLDLESIPSGSDWHGAIGTGLQECTAIIPIITKKYIESRFCMNELYTADGDKKLIFPIMYEDVDLASTEGGRALKFIVSGINWTMFRPGRDDYSDSLQKLIKGMKEKGQLVNSPFLHIHVAMNAIVIQQRNQECKEPSFFFLLFFFSCTQSYILTNLEFTSALGWGSLTCV